MITMLVSLQQAKIHLRVDTDDEDADIELKIRGASLMILRYLKDPTLYQDSSGVIPTDTAGNPLVEEHVQCATLQLIGHLYRDRDGFDMDKWQQGYLPFDVTALIYMDRDPSLGVGPTVTKPPHGC